MDANTGQSSKRAGKQLLESIFHDGTPSTSANAAHLASVYFAGRMEGKRLQLGNIDRTRPVFGPNTLGHHQIQRRDQRLIKKRRRQLSLPSSVKGKGKEKQEEQKPFSRRERQRLGLETIDENLSYEIMAPVHQLWLEYIHRLVAFIDENGVVQSNQFKWTTAEGKDGPVQVIMSANNVAAFQTSLVKADFCGALMRGE